MIIIVEAHHTILNEPINTLSSIFLNVSAYQKLASECALWLLWNKRNFGTVSLKADSKLLKLLLITFLSALKTWTKCLLRVTSGLTLPFSASLPRLFSPLSTLEAASFHLVPCYIICQPASIQHVLGLALPRISGLGGYDCSRLTQGNQDYPAMTYQKKSTLSSSRILC